jgi:hypothetical protein
MGRWCPQSVGVDVLNIIAILTNFVRLLVYILTNQSHVITMVTALFPRVKKTIMRHLPVSYSHLYTDDDWLEQLRLSFMTSLKDISLFNNLMFVPCIIRRSRNNQHYAQIRTTALFWMLVPTCFGSSLPFSGNVWIRLSYMKIQIDFVVYHIMWLSGLCDGVILFLYSFTVIVLYVTILFLIFVRNIVKLTNFL